MKYREKVFLQVIICCMIFTVVKAGSILNIKELSGLKASVKEQFEKDYSIEEVKEAGSALLEKAKDTPAAIASSVISDILFVLTPHLFPENELISAIVVISPKRTLLSELWKRSTIQTLL